MALRTKLIVNLTRGDALCVGMLADRPLSRMLGLMGRRGLPAGRGLLLSPAPGVHTAFMRFSIDVVFLDRELGVIGVVERLRPWRMAARRHARAVLELAAGECSRRGVRVGDRLALEEGGVAIDAAAEESGASPEPARTETTPRSGPVIWAHSLDEVRHLRGRGDIRVLVVSRDQHFRSVTSMLLTHRGCTVTTTPEPDRVPEMIRRERTNVVVIDAGGSPAGADAAAAVWRMARPVGIVLVDEHPGPSSSQSVAKWGPFEELFAAIRAADRRREASSR